MKRIVAVLVLCALIFITSACNKEKTGEISTSEPEKGKETLQGDPSKDTEETKEEETKEEEKKEESQKSKKEELLKNAYQGKIDGGEFGVGESTEKIMNALGQPEMTDNFLGGMYLKYGDIVYFSNGWLEDAGQGAVNHGEVVIISKNGNSPSYGIKKGMTLEEVKALLGEPDEVWDLTPEELAESELIVHDRVVIYQTGDYQVQLEFDKGKNSFQGFSIE